MPRPKKADPGDGCLFQRERRKNGRVYKDNYVIIARNEKGEQIRIPLGTKNYTEAKDKLHEWQVAKVAGDNSAIDGRITVIDYLHRWLAEKSRDASERGTIRPKSVVKYRNYITPFVNQLKGSGNEFLKMMDMKDGHFKDYQAWRLRQTRFNKPGGVPITPEGINREVRFLKGIFKNAHRDRLIPKDPTKGVENLKTVPKKITLPAAAELWEVFQATGDQTVMDYATTIACTGMRAMEAMSRKFKHVDLDRGILHICDDGDFKLKNANSARDIPLPDEVREMVLRIKDERKGVTEEDFVFVKADGSPLMDHRDHAYHTVTRTLKALNRTRRKAGLREIPYFHIRMLRHWYVSWSLNRPINPLTETQLIKVVGHADFEMIRSTYYHFDLEGEVGRKVRETRLFSDMDMVAGKNGGDGAPIDDANPDNQVMFKFSLRGA